MSSKRSAVNPGEFENVAKKSFISVASEKKIRRMEDGQTRPNVCRIVKLFP